MHVVSSTYCGDIALHSVVEHGGRGQGSLARFSRKQEDLARQQNELARQQGN